MKISVICQKCKKIERIDLHNTNIQEIYLTGSTNVAIYHTDHMLLLNVDRYGIRSQNICDPSSAMVYGINVHVGEYVLIRRPLILKGIEMVLLDKKKKIIDARLVSNYMYAISFARFAQRNMDENNKESNIFNIYGIKYLVGGNGGLLLAVPLTKIAEDIAEKWIDYVSAYINRIPLDLEDMINIFQKIGKNGTSV